MNHAFSNFSSPETKAHNVSLYDGTRAIVCVIRLSIHTFKYEYLCDQVADHNQILSEASFGWGRSALGFGANRIRALVSMATDTSHRVVMGKPVSSGFLKYFYQSFFILEGNHDMHRGLNEFNIWSVRVMDYRVGCL